jgi:hypothetical protein
MFSHILRHTSKLKEILVGKVEGTRARYRPAHKRTENIKKSSGYCMKECSIKAKECLRLVTANLKCGDGTP